MEFKKLKAYRQLKGINQSAMAKLLNISLNTYNFKENGKKSFTLDEAKFIADYFNTNIEEIFFSQQVNVKFTDAG
ncbi:helix-turn-helix transcriptional regulator [Clostridium senegalense]|uniref:helix-turn-helix transcriptional regulator n=1 Tax=Clostridium senegalense TaxID=1465809 RepID=UPI0002884F26|nr:helix-turn-helix transcriptional regulator [Clostridium senegalense]